MAANKARGVQEIGKFLLTPAPADRGGRRRTLYADEQQAHRARRRRSTSQLCFTCHGDDGRGTPMAGAPAGTMMAPSLAGSPRVQGHRDYVIKTLLHGLTGPLGDKTLPAGDGADGHAERRLDRRDRVLRPQRLRQHRPFVTPADVARVRAATTDRKTPWTAAEIEGTLPVLMQSHDRWKASASHNAATAAQGLTLAGWTSGEPQRPGMWFQVELPQPPP